MTFNRFSIANGHLGALPLMVTLAIIVLVSEAFSAEEPPDLVTDRPTKAANTAIVPPGYVLWESGFKFSRNDESGSRSDEFEFLDSVFRIGLAKKAELRLGWLSGKWKQSRATSSTDKSSGIGDATLGLKVRLRDEGSYTPAMALILATTLPVGDDEFSSERSDPSATVAFSHALPHNLGLVYNLGVEASSGRNSAGDKKTDTIFSYSAALSYGRNPLASPYIEAFGETPIDGSGNTDFSIGGGLTSLLLPNIQLDASGGVGLTGSTTDWFVGIGFSVRLPR